MPETYLVGETTATSETEGKRIPWFSITLDWPYETVAVEAQVTSTRKPNVLEWAVLRILEDFPEAPPTMAEAARQLAIMEPAFLTETIRRLAEGGILEWDDSQTEVELAHCRLTPKARDFLNAKPNSKFPERHGLKLCFDSVTGEHLPRPPRHGRAKPQQPILPAEQLPARQTHLGLDRARQWAQQQQEPFLGAHSEIKEVRVLEEQGGILWAPIRFEVSIETTGGIHFKIPAATGAQREWFDQLDVHHPVFDLIFRKAAPKDWPDISLPAPSFALWRQAIDRLIAPGLVEREVIDLIGQSQEEILLHSFWLNNSTIAKALQQAAGREVRCRAFGPPTNPGHALVDRLEHITAPNPLPVVLLVDGRRGLRLDRLRLHNATQKEREFIVPSFVKETHSVPLHQQILDQADVA